MSRMIRPGRLPCRKPLQLHAMKKIFCCLALLLTGCRAFAQAPLRLTLAEALHLAQENRLELKTQAMQVQLAEAANDKLRARWMPQVSAGADLRWNTQLQTNVLPVGAFGIPGVPADATRTVQFGSPFSHALSLQVEQKIVDFNRQLDRKINANALESQQNNLVQRQIDVRYDVTEAYYAALFQQERMHLAQLAVDRAQANLAVGQVRLSDGVLLPDDLDRLALDSSNTRLTYISARRDWLQSLETLRYRLQLPDDVTLELADGLDQLRQANATQPASHALERPEVRAERLAEQLDDLNRQKERMRNRPTLSAYGNYTLLQLHDTPNFFAAGSWFPYSYLGIRLTVPVYDGKQARLAARDYTWRQEIDCLNAEKREADFEFETDKYHNAIQQADLELQIARQNMVLATQILRTDQLRFSEGVILPTALKDSEYACQQAESNYLSAVYNWLMANLNWRRASGNL